MPYLLYSVEGNRQRLDGGAMFGNVPRPMWEAWAPPDARHRIELACRGFLIHDVERDRRVLLDTGIGVFFDPKLQDRYGVAEPGHQLLMSLAALDVEPDQIDVVVLSHLHFDHAGGLLTPWRPDGGHEIVFPRARYLASARAWQRARSPHLRDRASFVPELLDLLERSGRLDLADAHPGGALGPDFFFHLSDGHTPGLLLTELRTARGSVVFCGDLIPGRPWIHLPVAMGYDRFPELIVDEKASLLARCLENRTRLLLTHDPGCAMCSVGRDDKGRYGPRDEVVGVTGLEL
jgi:glyoxylase-like metal-dependent hydrolase (beta-lactamase superfamily II)